VAEINRHTARIIGIGDCEIVDLNSRVAIVGDRNSIAEGRAMLMAIDIDCANPSRALLGIEIVAEWEAIAQGIDADNLFVNFDARNAGYGDRALRWQ
jgi:hypothetical protein